MLVGMKVIAQEVRECRSRVQQFSETACNTKCIEPTPRFQTRVHKGRFNERFNSHCGGGMAKAHFVIVTKVSHWPSSGCLWRIEPPIIIHSNSISPKKSAFDWKFPQNFIVRSLTLHGLISFPFSESFCRVNYPGSENRTFLKPLIRGIRKTLRDSGGGTDHSHPPPAHNSSVLWTVEREMVQWHG
jgi:hypothetical protein